MEGKWKAQVLILNIFKHPNGLLSQHTDSVSRNSVCNRWAICLCQILDNLKSTHFYCELSTLGSSTGQFPTQGKALALFHDIYSKFKYFMLTTDLAFGPCKICGCWKT